MRDAVIVDAVRAPIGRRKGTLKGVHPVDLSASVLTALAGRNLLDPELIEDIVLGLRHADRGPVDQRRPARGAGRRVAGDDPRCHPRPRLRVEPAGGALRRRQRHRRPLRHRRGGRGGIDEQGPAGRRPGDGRAVRPPGARTLPARQLQPGPRRRGHRPPLGPVPHPARRVRARVPPQGGRRDRRRRLRRPARPRQRPGRRAQRRRGHPAGNLAGEARGAQARLPRRRRHPRGQQLADLRRVRGAADHHQRAGGRARPAPAGPVPLRRGDRRRPGDDADRADPRHREGAQAGRADDRRHRGVRGQRGVRERPAGLGGGNRSRSRAAQPARRRDRRRAPARRVPARS